MSRYIYRLHTVSWAATNIYSAMRKAFHQIILCRLQQTARYVRQKARYVRLMAKHVIHKMRGKQPVHFLHIGKTGGKAMKHTLRHYPASSHYAISLHPHWIRLSDIPKGGSVFFTLRDPISWYTSAFYSNRQGRPPKGSQRWSEDEKMHLNISTHRINWQFPFILQIDRKKRKLKW